MLDIQAVNHVGIRVADKGVSIAFYELLGFELLSDVGFEKGHPVIMKHGSGMTHYQINRLSAEDHLRLKSVTMLQINYMDIK